MYVYTSQTQIRQKVMFLLNWFFSYVFCDLFGFEYVGLEYS